MFDKKKTAVSPTANYFIAEFATTASLNSVWAIFVKDQHLKIPVKFCNELKIKKFFIVFLLKVE